MSLSKIITCGHCSNISAMEILGQVTERLTKDVDDDLHGPFPEEINYFAVLICPACKKKNIVEYYWNDFMESDDDLTYTVLYPADRDFPIGLPDSIGPAFRAAEKVRFIDVNAYAILMRRLLELVCLDRKAKGKTLALMLNDLATKKEIPDKLVKVAGGLRIFGNIGAHAGAGELSENEIPIVFSLTRAILEYIYSAPYLAKLAEEKLKEITGADKKNKRR